MIEVTIYSRPECHLCAEMKAVVHHVAATLPLVVREIDISTDADLDRQYGVEIPVLFVNGRKAAKYRITAAELTRIVNARTGADSSISPSR